MSRRRAAPAVVASVGELSVLRDPSRPGGRLLRQRGMDASYVDLADPRHLEFDYLRWMAAVVGAVPGVRDIVHVGGAAGALARSLAAASPGLRQELVEISPDVVAVAREHLGLRRAPGLRVRVADGREFVAARGDLSVDAVLIDAFDGAIVPAHLVSEAAFADVARVLRAGGVAAVNVVDARGLPSTRAIAAAAASSFSHVALVGPSAVVHGRQSGNTIVVARREPIPEDRIRTLVARDPSPATLVRAAGMPSRAERRVATHRTA